MTPTTIRDLRLAGAMRAIARLHRDERGLLSGVNLVTITMIMVLLVTIMNVGHVTHNKLGMQNAADAAALSAAVMNARLMNAVTATNHVIGEMVALVSIHEAVGGKELDAIDSNEKATAIEDGELDDARRAANEMGASTLAYETVRQKGGIFAGRTLLDCKKLLKKYLAWCYWQKALAKAMQRSCIHAVVVAGIALEVAMDAFELVIWNEYNILNIWHEIAKSLLPAKKIIRDELMPYAKGYTNAIVDNAPELARQTAEEIASLNGYEGTLFSLHPGLPLVIDPAAKAQTLPSNPGATRRQIVKISQLARAGFPWVNYHRKPILDITAILLPLCRASHYYFDHSTRATIRVCNVLQMYNDMGLYVLKGYEPPDKGYEKWQRNSALVDKLFCPLGIVYDKPPTVYGQSPTHCDGMLAYAQAMIYNANEEQPHECRIDLGIKQITPHRQANCGWDTLNWMPRSGPADNNVGTAGDSAAAVNSPFEVVTLVIPSEFPQIQVNWQAKLTPATVTVLDGLRQAATCGNLPEPYSKVAGHLLESIPASQRTH
jgi:hypothetical protein